MVEETVKSCIACQASNPKPTTREPLSMTPLPSSPWSEVAVDFAGPFPSGDYALVVIDEYSRFPEVEIVTSTSAKTVIPRLDAIFARQGIPAVVKTDNGPPFNGNEFKAFSDNLGFKHRRITPLWPEANGSVERFMETLNKHVRVSSVDNSNWKTTLHQFLRQYRATPHSSTKVSPFEALTGRKMNCGLPTLQPTPFAHSMPTHSIMSKNDDASKMKMKAYADARRRTAPCTLTPGTHVLVKQPKTNKLTPPFDPNPYTIVEKKGAMITASRGSHRIVRNSSYFRRSPIPPPVSAFNDEEEEEEDEANPSTQPNDGTPEVPGPPVQSWSSPRPAMQSWSSPRSPAQPGPSYGSTPVPVAPSPRPARVRNPPAYLKDYDTT